MIALVEGCHIRQVIGRATSQPRLFKRVIVASPFIDYRGTELLHRLYVATRGDGPDVQVLTTPSGRELVEKYCPPRDRFRVDSHPDLHAKLYLLLGNSTADHEALVTSANLTAPGLGRNVELGLRLTASSPVMITLIERLAERLAN